MDSIKSTFEYDSEGLRQQAEDALKSWLKILSPDDAGLSEKLKIVVINPPWEHRKGEDGHYIDVASENAKSLAMEVSHNIDELLPNLHLLLQGEQKQSFSFGYQLSLSACDLDLLIESSFEKILFVDQANPRFILGMYTGIFEQSYEAWQKYIDKLLGDERLVHLYPEFIRTGKIQKSHLEILLDLIRSGDLPPNSANALSYGSVTDGIARDIIADFCLKLSELGGQASWSALNVIYMYCFSKKGSVDM